LENSLPSRLTQVRWEHLALVGKHVEGWQSRDSVSRQFGRKEFRDDNHWMR
jgi:hypothetical protein